MGTSFTDHQLIAVLESPSAKKAAKRQAPDQFNDDDDTENIDPVASLSAKKTSSHDKVVPRFILTPSSRRGKLASIESKTPLPTKSSIVTVSSAPAAPAGRSPPRKKRVSASRPSLAKVPFSLNAALSQTLKAKPEVLGARNGQDFTIYEDTPEDEVSNLMPHSTRLVSELEEKALKVAADAEDKENIAPQGVAIVPPQSPVRREAMLDQPRTPLADLDAEDYYGPGCDAQSSFIVPGDDHDVDSPAMETPAVSV